MRISARTLLAVCGTAAVFTAATVGTAHAEIRRVPCKPSGIEAVIKTKTGNLCFSTSKSDETINVAIYGVTEVQADRGRRVTITYTMGYATGLVTEVGPGIAMTFPTGPIHKVTKLRVQRV